MRGARIFTLARRVIRQFARDHRTVGLLVVVPIIVLSLSAFILRADPAPIPLGIVNEDEGVTHPALGTLVLGERMTEALDESDHFAISMLRRDEIEVQLREGLVQGVLVLPADLSAQFLAERAATLDLRLEGSNPTRSQVIRARVLEAATRAVAGLASVGLGAGVPGASDEPQLPLRISAMYLFGGEAFDTMDFIAPVYIALLAIFFVFLLTCVSFLRERAQGTMERLLATPATRLEIVLGYMLGLGTFALAQVSIILFFTVWVLEIHYAGSLALVFVVVLLLALVGVSMGMVASVFARNEFQVVQFIPLLIFPQVLLAGTVWAVEDMPALLQPLSYVMPLRYANDAMRDVMIKGFGLAEIWPQLLALVISVLVLTGLGALTMRREVA